MTQLLPDAEEKEKTQPINVLRGIIHNCGRNHRKGRLKRSLYFSVLYQIHIPKQK